MSLIIYEKKGRIAYITLNRPEVLNAMNNQMKRDFTEVLVDFRDDPEVWVGIVFGAGDKAFSTGSDVKEIGEWYASEPEPFPMEPQPFIKGQIEIWKPLIAAINGWCVGGGFELALVCDIRIATKDARFGEVEPKVGELSETGAIRLPNQVPFAIAMEMLLTGDTIDAQRAYEIGLINQVVPSSEKLMPAAHRMAERILACAPLAVRVNKEQALRGFSTPLALGLPLVGVGKADIQASHDAKEGMRAFAEKRKPVWTGK